MNTYQHLTDTLNKYKCSVCELSTKHFGNCICCNGTGIYKTYVFSLNNNIEVAASEKNITDALITKLYNIYNE